MLPLSVLTATGIGALLRMLPSGVYSPRYTIPNSPLIKRLQITCY